MISAVIGRLTRRPLFLTEYGVCGGQDHIRCLRNLGRLHKENARDGWLFRERLDASFPTRRSGAWTNVGPVRKATLQKNAYQAKLATPL